MTHESVTASGIVLRQRAAFSVSKPLRLLWVHGYTLDSTIWEPLWDCLPEISHVALDLPGHGQSPPFSKEVTLDSLGHAVLEAAETTAATDLVGLSFGGTVALQAAILAPTRFGSVFLASPGLAGGPEDRECADCHHELIQLAAARGRGPWLRDRWMAVPPRIFEGTLTRPELPDRFSRIVNRHRWDELFTGCMAAMQTASQPPRALAAVRSRVFLIVGGEDMPAFVRAADLLRRRLQSVPVYYLDGSKHLSLLEEPFVSAQWIRQCLSGVPSGEAHS